MVVNYGSRYKQTGKAGELGSETQVAVFLVDVEIFVEPAQFVKHGFSVHGSAGAGAEHTLGLIVLSLIELQSSPLEKKPPVENISPAVSISSLRSKCSILVAQNPISGC